MGRKPDIQRLLSRYADLNPPLGYPGGSCHLQDRIRQEVSNKRNQNHLLDHHLSGGDKKPNDRYERAIYDSIDEGPVKGTSFRRVMVSEHAQYRMDQRGVTVSDIRLALQAFQKEWLKERNRGIASLTRLLQQPNEFHYDHDGIRFFMRPLKLWTPKDKKVDVWIRTLYPLSGRSRPVPPDECKSFPGWSEEYPEHGFERLFPKRVAQRFADLTPPLGYPGGSCHLIERVHDEVDNPRLRDRLVDSLEEGQSFSNADASKVYSPEGERGIPGKRLNRILLTSHVQYRMDQRGITVPEIRLALKQFAKAYLDEKSRKSLQARLWDEATAWGGSIKWEAPIGLVVVFTLPSQDTANIVTAYWQSQSDPRPKDETDCGFPSAGRVAAGLGDCYEANGKYFMDKALFPGTDKSLRLVHGEVTGQGPLSGVNYGHAWVEDGNTVIDVSNGKNVRMPKDLYYALGGIDRNDNLHKYTAREFQRKISDYEHWGPWDLRTSTGL